MNRLNKIRFDGLWWFDDNDIAYSTKLSCLQNGYLGLCSCGNPDEITMYVISMLERLENRSCGEYEDMPYMFFVSWANEQGYAEHGTAIKNSWLTDDGKQLLDMLREEMKESD